MSVDPNANKRGQASEALKRIAPQLKDLLVAYPSNVSHMLNDLVPHAQNESFALASALHNVRFRSAVTTGLQLSDAMRLRQFMVSELGFSEMIAAWVAESWLAAFDVRGKESTDHRFKCPSCIQEFVAASYWRNQKLVCPSCNSHVLFSESLIPQLHRKGWAQKRQKGGDWKLVGVSGKSRSTLIREQLQKLLSDSGLQEQVVARELGLDEIVDAIPDEVEKSLARRGRALSQQQRAAIIRALVRTHVGKNALEMQFILRPPRQQLSDENLGIVASFSWVDHSGSAVLLTFEVDHLCYEAAGTVMKVPYFQLGRQSMVRGNSPTELRIGDFQSIRLSGTGIPPRKWLDLFNSIGEVFRELENA